MECSSIVSFEENEYHNCWEFMKCPEKIKKQCNVYLLDYGRDCWFFKEIRNGGIFRLYNGGCVKCTWFKKNNPELTAMIENLS